MYVSFKLTASNKNAAVGILVLFHSFKKAINNRCQEEGEENS
jgi:hypothetical protein